MAETRVDMDREGKGRRTGRCLGRLGSTVLVALVCLLLAQGDPSPLTVTVLVTGVWLWLATSVLSGIVRMVLAANAMAGSEASEQKNRMFSIFRFPRICAWAGVLLLAVATAALFATGQSVLATTMEVFLLWRVIFTVAGDRPCPPERNAPAAAVDYTPLTSGSGIFGICVTAGALWLATGTPPFWAESMILAYFWIVVVGTIVVSNAVAFGLTVGRSWMQKHHEESWRQSGTQSGRPPPLFPPITPEPPRPLSQQFTMWVWRASWLAIAWALWTAGQPLLAGLYLLSSLLKLAVRVRVRRQKHGETARIDFLARAVHLVVWWPLVIAGTVLGTVAAAVVFVPLAILGAIWELIFGKSEPAGPDRQTNWEREVRLERARIRRAAASYRLREAFGQPGGFVYFLYAEPHQRAHFLGAGGILAGLGDRVVARDWREDVTRARKAPGGRRFAQTPEGALLQVNGIGNMRNDLPFIAVVPARGIVQVFGLAYAYRARGRDRGAALDLGEVEVHSAIAVALGIGAG